MSSITALLVAFDWLQGHTTGAITQNSFPEKSHMKKPCWAFALDPPRE